MSVIVLCLCLALRPMLPAEDSPVVRLTSLGSLRGTTAQARGGEIYHEFRGVPFAAPPLGPLR